MHRGGICIFHCLSSYCKIDCLREHSLGYYLVCCFSFDWWFQLSNRASDCQISQSASISDQLWLIRPMCRVAMLEILSKENAHQVFTDISICLFRLRMIFLLPREVLLSVGCLAFAFGFGSVFGEHTRGFSFWISLRMHISVTSKQNFENVL